MSNIKLLGFAFLVFAAGALVGARVYSWFPYYPSYHACVLDNMKRLQSDAAANIIRGACQRYGK